MSKFALLEINLNNEVIRWCNTNTKITSISGVFSPLPEIELSEIITSGLMDAEEITFEFPAKADKTNFSRLATSEYASESSRVKIYLYVDGTFKMKFYGRISSVERNPAGKPGHLKVYCTGMKAELDIPLGLRCLDTCTRNFGNCGFDLNPYKETATIVALDSTGRVVNLTFTQTLEDKRYAKGRLILNGVTYIIRKLASNYAYLNKPMHPDSVSSGPDAAIIVPGCGHNKESCVFYGNEANFQAWGDQMPSYNPLFEVEQE